MKTLVSFLMAIALTAGAHAAEGDKDAPRRLAEGDLKSLRSSTEKIVVLLLNNDKTKRLEEQQKLQKQLDDLAKKHKWSPLADTESWATLMHEAFVPEKLPKDFRAASDFMQKPVALKDNDFKGREYLLSIPKDYKPEKRLPVLVLLHGKVEGTGKLQDKVREWASKLYPKEFRDQFIIVVPIDLPGEKEGDRDPDWASLQRGVGADQLMWTLREGVFESLGYDPKRLILDGDGDAVRFASYFPGIFAAVVCRGAPPEGVCGENLGNSQVLIVGPPELAKKAGEADISPLKADNVADDAAAADWVLKSTPKNWNPPKLKHRTDNSSRAANFWLDAEVDAVDSKTPLGNFPSYEAEANRETNEILIKANERVRALRVFLNDEIVDLEKPIKIIVNGVTKWEGKVARDLEGMFLTSYNGSNSNVGAVYVKVISITLK